MAQTKTWDQMTTEENVERLKTFLDNLSQHQNTVNARLSNDMDDAKDRLSGNFEQARLFFAKATINAIAEYEKFDRTNAALPLAKLPDSLT